MADEDPRRAAPTVFLLSPADTRGDRTTILLSERARFALAVQLRSAGGAPLGEVFTFLSGLYFRGKLTYARRFARPPRGLPGAFVITAGEGLLAADTPVDAARLRAFAGVPVSLSERRYTEPLRQHAQALATLAGEQCRFVLLGSVATGKYVAPLLEVLDERLLFPADFVGRGDMSRGGLLLRASDAGRELSYLPVRGASVHGPRPPRLPPRRPRSRPAGP